MTIIQQNEILGSSKGSTAHRLPSHPGDKASLAAGPLLRLGRGARPCELDHGLVEKKERSRPTSLGSVPMATAPLEPDQAALTSSVCPVHSEAASADAVHLRSPQSRRTATFPPALAAGVGTAAGEGLGKTVGAGGISKLK